jgi:hypothetical protein
VSIFDYFNKEFKEEFFIVEIIDIFENKRLLVFSNKEKNV